MNYALRLPDYYKKEIESLKGDTSINQFIMNAVVEKIATLKTEAYLQERAQLGSRSHGLAMLNQVADVPAEQHDQLPSS